MEEGDVGEDAGMEGQLGNQQGQRQWKVKRLGSVIGLSRKIYQENVFHLIITGVIAH